MKSIGEDFLLEIKVRNGRVMSAIRGAGYDSVARFCRDHDVGYTSAVLLISLKKSPIHKLTGGWCKAALELSDALRTMPEDLFPEEWREMKLSTNKVERYISQEDMIALQAVTNPETAAQRSIAVDKLDEALESLMPRYAHVLRLRFGLGGEGKKTLEECSQELGVTRERVRQMEIKALRILKHPSRKHLLDIEAYDEPECSL